MFRQDRDIHSLGVTRDGGVLISVRNKYKATSLDLSFIQNAMPSIDIVGIKLHLGHHYLVDLNIYIPPKTSSQDFEAFFDLLSTIEALCNIKVLILSDFNASDFTNTTNRTVNVIKNFSEFYGLKQFNEVRNAHNNILDLVFSNTDCKVEPSDSALVKEDPHHPCLWTKVYIPIALPNQFPMNKNPESYNFKKADYPRLYQTICNTN